ncbi:hypothetical protein WA026_018119 [Henosepilachna vigintioctopunctata]|uniref:Biogenesis of lysosome-related organelles complex 1 subunit 3 n=1 Tax=Henosepilachna vigintioctopunctata TaxID=420089 RepID=A0AAW1ULE7_9CUCU
MNKAVIVNGEASETESEDEANIIYETEELVTDQIKCQTVIGEDTESENENNDKNFVDLTSNSIVKEEYKKPEKSTSLLHQKLRESNIAFYNNLENFIKNAVNESEKSLTEVDQRILKSQLVVQGAASSLKNLNLQANTLKNKLHAVLSSNFLSNVKITE